MIQLSAEALRECAHKNKKKKCAFRVKSSENNFRFYFECVHASTRTWCARKSIHELLIHTRMTMFMSLCFLKMPCVISLFVSILLAHKASLLSWFDRIVKCFLDGPKPFYSSITLLLLISFRTSRIVVAIVVPSLTFSIAQPLIANVLECERKRDDYFVD